MKENIWRPVILVYIDIFTRHANNELLHWSPLLHPSQSMKSDWPLGPNLLYFHSLLCVCLSGLAISMTQAIACKRWWQMQNSSNAINDWLWENVLLQTIMSTERGIIVTTDKVHLIIARGGTVDWPLTPLAVHRSVTCKDTSHLPHPDGHQWKQVLISWWKVYSFRR